MRYLGMLLYLILYGIPFLGICLLLSPLFILALILDMWQNRKYYRYRIQKGIKSFAFHSLINKWVALGYIFVLFVLASVYFSQHNTIGTWTTETYPGIIEGFLRVNSVLVGVIISLLILTFRVLNENYGTFAFRAIFKSKYNRILISLFLFNFFLTLYALSYWNQNTVNAYYHTLFWISFSSNSILLCLAFPFAFLSLKSASHSSNIDAIIDTLDQEWIGKYQTNQMNHPRVIFPLKENPLEELTQVARKAIASEDYETFRTVSDRFYNHLIQLAKDKEYLLGFLLSEYTSYIRNLFSGALKSEDIYFTSYLVFKRIQLEQFFLELKLPKDQNPVWRTNLNYLQIDFGPYVHKSLLVEDSVHIEEVLGAYLRIGEYYIQKVIPKELPEYDSAEFSKYSDIKFFISNFYGSAITSMAERLSDAGKLRSFQKLFSIFSLQSTVLASSASNSTKTFLIHVLETAKRDTYKIYVDSDPSRISYLFFPFSTSYIFDQELKQLDRFQTLNGLLWACDYSLQGGKLNNIILNQLKASMLGLIRLQVKDNLNVKKPFIRCLEEYDKLRSNLEDGTTMHDQDMYVKIHEYLTFLEKESKDQGMWDDELKNKFLVVQTRFSKLQEFRKNFDDSYYLRDERFT